MVQTPGSRFAQFLASGPRPYMGTPLGGAAGALNQGLIGFLLGRDARLGREANTGAEEMFAAMLAGGQPGMAPVSAAMPSPAPQPATAPQLPPVAPQAPDALESYYQAVAQRESGGNPTAENPYGAAGTYQFIPSTWGQYAGRLGLPEDPTLATPEQQRAAMEAFTADNEAAFREAMGRAPDNAERYLMHFQGAGLAPHIINAPAGSSLYDVIALNTDVGHANRVFEQNPNLRRDMTTGDLIRMMYDVFPQEVGYAPGMGPQAAGGASVELGPVPGTMPPPPAAVAPVAQAPGVMPAGLAQPGGAQPAAAGAQPPIAQLLSLLQNPHVAPAYQQLAASLIEQQMSGRAPFEGTSMAAQMRNILYTANPGSREYADAYAYLSQPQVLGRDQLGNIIMSQPADLSMFQAPAGRSAAPATGTGAGTAGGVSTIETPAARQERLAQERAAQNSAAFAQQGMAILTQDITRAIDIIDNYRGVLPITGIWADDFQGLSQEGTDLAGLLRTVRANVGFDRLQRLRMAGGTLGAITEGERVALESTMGDLEQSTSKEQLRTNLARIHNISIDLVYGIGEGPPRVLPSGANAAYLVDGNVYQTAQGLGRWDASRQLFDPVP